MPNAKKPAEKTAKRKPLEERKMTTQRYIDDSEGITVTKRPTKQKGKK